MAESHAPVPVSVDVPLAGTRLRLQLQIAGQPTRPTRLLPLLRAVDDALIKDALGRLVAGGRAVSCGVGCAACCRYLVPIARAEAWRLAETVAALPAPRRAAVEARFAAARERLAAAGLLERLRRPEDLTPEDLGPIGDAYFALGLACPLLEEERCSIYAERPLPCREHLVASPRAICGETGAPAVEVVKLPARASVAAAALGDGPSFEAGGWVPLVLALEWAAASPEPPPRTPGPALVERFFAALAEDAGSPPDEDAQPPRP